MKNKLIKKIFIFFLIALIFINYNYKYAVGWEDPRGPILEPPIGDPGSNTTGSNGNGNQTNGNNGSNGNNQNGGSKNEPPRPAPTNFENDADVKQAMYSCEKAIKLASMYGLFVDFSGLWNNVFIKLGKDLKDYVKQQWLDSITSWTRETAKNILGKELNINDFIKDLASETGIDKFGEAAFKNITKKFNEIFPVNKITSAFSSEVKKEVDDLFKNSISQLVGVENDYLSKLTGKIGSGVKSLAEQEVPVSDKGTQQTVKESAKAQVEASQAILNELKRQQTIQTLREKCTNLLKQTIAEIKNSLAFQLSTQIIDWALNDENFLKHTDKLGEIAKKTIRNNFLSNVIPEACSNFNFNAILSESINLDLPDFGPGNTRPPFEWRCTLDEVEQNIETIRAFMKDFKKGKMSYYLKLLKPENDAMTVALTLGFEASKKYNEEIKRLEKLENNGFLAKTTCKQFRLYERIGSINDQLLIEQLRNSNIHYIKYGNYLYTNTEYIYDAEAWKEFYDKNKDYMIADFTGPIYYYSTYYLFLTSTSQLIKEAKTRSIYEQNIGIARCEDIEITQPASVAQNYLNKATQQELDTIKEAEDLERYFENVKKSIINKLIIQKNEKGLSDALNWLVDKKVLPQTSVPLIKDMFGINRGLENPSGGKLR